MTYGDVNLYILASGIINLIIWACACFWFFGGYKIPIYHPVSLYLIYHFLGFVVRPFSIYASNWSFIWYRIGFLPNIDDIVIATFVYNLALLSCVAGATIGMGRDTSRKLIPPTQLQITKPQGFLVAMGILLALGLYSTYRAYGTAGLDTVASFDVNIDAAGGQRLVGISGYTLALAEALPILCIVLLFANVPRWFAYGMTALFVLIRIYVGAQRLSFVVVIAAALFGILVAQRRSFPTMTVVLALVLGAVTFDFIGQDRFVIRRVVAGEAGIGELFTSYAEKRVSPDSKAMDIVEYETGAVAISIVRDYSGYSYGTQYLRALIWPIPRQLWQDKPVLTSTVNLNKYQYNFLNLTHTLYADLYMALGLPAVGFGMLVFGWGMAKVYELGRSTRKPLGYVFFWIFLIYLQTILRDGGASFVFFWGFSLLFAFLLIKGGGIKVVRAPEGPTHYRKRPTSRSEARYSKPALNDRRRRR